jgi:hypothetical protein
MTEYWRVAFFHILENGGGYVHASRGGLEEERYFTSSVRLASLETGWFPEPIDRSNSRK